MDTICPTCGYVFEGHSNTFFGKICLSCGSYIEPIEELPIVKENKRKLELLLAEVREVIRLRLEEYKEKPDGH